MAEISKKIRQSKVLCGENKIPYARAVTLMSLITFTILGAEQKLKADSVNKVRYRRSYESTIVLRSARVMSVTGLKSNVKS